MIEDNKEGEGIWIFDSIQKKASSKRILKNETPQSDSSTILRESMKMFFLYSFYPGICTDREVYRSCQRMCGRMECSRD